MNTNDFATRRRFFFGAGAAALAAPAALAATGDAPPNGNRALLEARLAALEDANAIRDLQRAYLRCLSARDDAAAAELFDDPRAGLDAKRQDGGNHVAGFVAEPADATVEIAADRSTAAASMTCFVRLESPIDAPGCTLVDMARAQGEGVVRSSGRRRLEQSFVRRNGVWKIASSRIREPV